MELRDAGRVQHTPRRAARTSLSPVRVFLGPALRVGLVLLFSGTAAGARAGLAAASPADPSDHADPVASILLVLVFMAVGAVLGGRWMRRVGQPAVLGKLLMGVLLANLGYALHEPVTTVLRNDAAMVEVIQVALHEDISLSEAVHRVLPNPEGDRLAQILVGPSGPQAVAIHHFVDLLSRSRSSFCCSWSAWKPVCRRCATSAGPAPWLRLSACSHPCCLALRWLLG